MKFGDKLYYENELTDEVIDYKITPIKIDKNYKYVRKNIFYRFFSFITYRFIATPIVWFYFKFIKKPICTYVFIMKMFHVKHFSFFIIYNIEKNRFLRFFLIY